MLDKLLEFRYSSRSELGTLLDIDIFARSFFRTYIEMESLLKNDSYVDLGLSVCLFLDYDFTIHPELLLKGFHYHSFFLGN